MNGTVGIVIYVLVIFSGLSYVVYYGLKMSREQYERKAMKKAKKRAKKEKKRLKALAAC